MELPASRSERAVLFGAVLTLLVCGIWYFQDPGFEPLLGMVAAIIAIAGSQVFSRNHDAGLALIILGFCVIGVCLVLIRRDAVVSGFWRGTLTDETDVQFVYQLVLTQDGPTVKGQSLVRFKDPDLSQYYMRAHLEGAVEGKVVTFNEVDFIAYVPEPGGIWCLSTVELRHHSSNGEESLSGIYFDRRTIPECGLTGKIIVTKPQ
jgi:hypothetical protein